MCVRIAVDLNIFNTISENKGMPTTAAEIAEKSGALKLLVGTESSSHNELLRSNDIF